MRKTDGMSWQHCRETMDEAFLYFDLPCTIVSDFMTAITKTGFAAAKEARLSSLGFISGILIIFFSITGCTESPYAGSMLELSDVDKYISQHDDELFCLQNESDAACLKLTPKRRSTDNVKVPVIHIHPQKLVYIFYYEGRQILRAERAVDTRELVKALTAGTKPDPLQRDVDVSIGGSDDNPTRDDPPLTNNNPPVNTPPFTNPPVNIPPSTNPPVNPPVNIPPSTNSPVNPPVNPPPSTNPPVNTPPISQNPVSSDGSIDAHHVYNDGWIIWIDYPDGTESPEIPELGASGLNIKINGKPVTENDLRNFALVESYDGTKGVQFFYPTGETDSSQLEIEVDGLVKDEETVKFSINSPVDTSPDHVTYQMQPL